MQPSKQVLKRRSKPCPRECGNSIYPTTEICKPCRHSDMGWNEVGRFCSLCGIHKSWDEFNKDKGSPNGKMAKCKTCRAKLTKEKRYYLNKTVWTAELWDMCFDLQDGICANEGCGYPAEVADHDHDTGEPRALLCSWCNRCLGTLKEDPGRISGLARYAEQCQNVKLTWQRGMEVG